MSNDLPAVAAPFILDLSQQHSDADLSLYANRLMRQRAEIDAEAKTLTEAAKRDVAAIAAGWELVTKPLADRGAAIDDELKLIAARLSYADGVKSRKLQAGIIGARTDPSRIKVADDDKLLAWAKKNAPTIVASKTTESVPHKDLVKWMTDHPTSPMPDGVERTKASELYYVELHPVLHVRIGQDAAGRLAR